LNNEFKRLRKEVVLRKPDVLPQHFLGQTVWKITTNLSQDSWFCRQDWMHSPPRSVTTAWITDNV